MEKVNSVPLVFGLSFNVSPCLPNVHEKTLDTTLHITSRHTRSHTSKLPVFFPQNIYLPTPTLGQQKINSETDLDFGLPVLFISLKIVVSTTQVRGKPIADK